MNKTSLITMAAALMMLYSNPVFAMGGHDGGSNAHMDNTRSMNSQQHMDSRDHQENSLSGHSSSGHSSSVHNNNQGMGQGVEHNDLDHENMNHNFDPEMAEDFSRIN